MGQWRRAVGGEPDRLVDLLRIPESVLLFTFSSREMADTYIFDALLPDGTSRQWPGMVLRVFKKARQDRYDVRGRRAAP